MNRRTTFAMHFLVGAVALGPLMSPAARAYPTSCGADTYSFQGEINVFTDGAYYYWESAGGAVYNTGRSSNNVNVRLYSQHGTFGSNSPDSLDDGQWYGHNFFLAFPVSEPQYVLIEAIFDKNNAPDPRCYAG